jgi:putative transposase
VTVALHLIQRSRGPCFSNAQDCLSYLDLLCTFAPHYECTVHAYVLMANHVHLLITSADTSAGADLARALSDDELEIRPVHARRYLLACMRYIELNPVRAHVVEQPADYRWSSFRSNALGYQDAIVRPHPLYYALGRSTDLRRRAYANFVRRGFARPDRASP